MVQCITVTVSDNLVTEQWPNTAEHAYVALREGVLGVGEGIWGSLVNRVVNAFQLQLFPKLNYIFYTYCTNN